MQLPPLTLANDLTEALPFLLPLLIVSGYFFVRYRRNQQQYELMRLALEKGVTYLPMEAAPPPSWLRSMRTGVTLLALGLGLLAVGGIAFALVPHEVDGARIPAAIGMAVGGILTPLGLARLLFARVERRCAEANAARTASFGADQSARNA